MCLGCFSQLLWRVSGAYKPCYIFGTHHLAPQSFIDKVPGLAEAMQDVDLVCGELRLDELLNPNTSKTLVQAMTAPADSTLDKVVTAEDYHLIAVTLNHYFNGLVNIDNLKGFKPATITTQLELMEAVTHFPDYNPKEQIDIALQKRAKEKGKAIAGLERVNDQLEVLLGQPIAQQAQDLIDVCRNEKQFASYNKQLVDAYRAMDLTKIEELVRDPELGFDDASLERMVYARNRRWVKALLPMMRDGNTVLVVVGAAHLIGEQGLIELLRAEGFTVTPVGDEPHLKNRQI